MSKGIILDAGVTALVGGQSGSNTYKQVIVQVVDHKTPAEDLYLYGNGVDSLRPPAEEPPIEILGKAERELSVFVKNDNKQSTFVQWTTVDDPINPGNQFTFLFFADEAGTMDVDNTIVVLSLLKNFKKA